MISYLPHLLAWQLLSDGAQVLCLQDGRVLSLQHPDPRQGLLAVVAWSLMTRHVPFPVTHHELRSLAEGTDLHDELGTILDDIGLSCAWVDSPPSWEQGQTLAARLWDVLEQTLKGAADARA